MIWKRILLPLNFKFQKKRRFNLNDFIFLPPALSVNTHWLPHPRLLHSLTNSFFPHVLVFFSYNYHLLLFFYCSRFIIIFFLSFLRTNLLLGRIFLAYVHSTSQFRVMLKFQHLRGFKTFPASAETQKVSFFIQEIKKNSLNPNWDMTWMH